MQPNKRVVIGLSGGVDSAVCALLLQREGYEVQGVSLRLKPEEGAREDLRDAQRIAEHLQIPLAIVDLRREFAETVIAYFTQAYCSGMTPNPCVVCNPAIKFAALLDFAKADAKADAQTATHEAYYVATGHYAILREENGRMQLRKAESAKDQSYFLHGLRQEQLRHILFPLGGMTKQEVRELAQREGLPVAQKGDSQEVCFVPGDDYLGFLRQQGIALPPPGAFLSRGGDVLGRHQGIAAYTIGQRKGLGAFGKPMYVVGIDPLENTVTLGEEGTQYSTACLVDTVNWIAGEEQAIPAAAQVKLRNQAKPVPATLCAQADGSILLQFESPVRSVTPGQYAVFYKEDLVLGGGRIVRGDGT